MNILENQKYTNSYITQLQIDFKALMHNIKQIKSYAPNKKILAMLKGNAYGHGLLPIAKAISQNVDGIGVMHLHDAELLRRANISNTIVMLGGFSTLEELLLISKLNCDIVVHSEWQINIIRTIRLNNKISVWLKMNIGMNRLGFSPTQTIENYNLLKSNSNVNQDINLISHLSNADEIDSFKNKQQIYQFAEIVRHFPGEKSLSNSAAILQKQGLEYSDWIRPGLILFGVSPIINTEGKNYGLLPVMNYTTTLLSTRKHKKGDHIGYGNKWICPKDNMLLGIIPIGYADGLPRNIIKPVPVYINGQLCKIIEQISMHMAVIDLTNCPSAKPGNVVTLWGDNLPIEKIAAEMSTIPNELLVKLPTWLKRIKTHNIFN